MRATGAENVPEMGVRLGVVAIGLFGALASATFFPGNAPHDILALAQSRQADLALDNSQFPVRYPDAYIVFSFSVCRIITSVSA